VWVWSWHAAWVELRRAQCFVFDEGCLPGFARGVAGPAPGADAQPYIY
ncbi:hypothetical protein A2U01_0081129, partial [Trifolium medium]|nr:hypothetical protein [Trifolium medium]